MTRFSSIFAALALVVPSQISIAGPSPSVETIIPEDAYKQILRGTAVLIDVRDAFEIEQGMAAPALWSPIADIEADDASFGRLLSSATRGRLIVFYCASGRRAGRAAARAARLGYHAANMGGFDAWLKAGLPTMEPELRS